MKARGGIREQAAEAGNTGAHALPGNKPDMVNKPPHYHQGGIECIVGIRASLTEEEFRGFCKGTAMAYLWRERHKNGDEDIGKAGWYLDELAGRHGR